MITVNPHHHRHRECVAARRAERHAEHGRPYGVLDLAADAINAAPAPIARAAHHVSAARPAILLGGALLAVLAGSHGLIPWPS